MRNWTETTNAKSTMVMRCEVNILYIYSHIRSRQNCKLNRIQLQNQIHFCATIKLRVVTCQVQNLGPYTGTPSPHQDLHICITLDPSNCQVKGTRSGVIYLSSFSGRPRLIAIVLRE